MKANVLADIFKRYVCILLAFVVVMLDAHAQESQELNCTVEVNADQIENSSKEVFETLEQAISEYINTNKWTNAQFAINERIECRMYFTIKSYEDDKFTGELQVQSMRPVYNSSYTTTVLNFRDTNIEFTYIENEPLVFSELSMESNLTAIINFYCYMIIAMDFDTFSLEGGTPYYESAANVVRLAQSSGESGWKAFEDNKNRSAVLSAYTDNATRGIRTILYNYHRLGLDQMAVSVDKGRATVTSCIEELKKVYDAAPMSVCLSIFKDAKLDELVNIYSKAGVAEKNKVYELLYPLYPTDGTRLNKIKEQSK